MEKDLFEMIVKSVTNCDVKTKQVMDIVYGQPKKASQFSDYILCDKNHLYKNSDKCPYCAPKLEDFVKCGSGHFYGKNMSTCPYCPTNDVVIVPTKQNNKKKEIEDSLDYLKNKCNKSKQDRESIYSLEMVLKNMK
jgi:hypothetical protein